MHGEIMIQDQRAKATVIWTMAGRVKSGFLNILWLVDKYKGDNVLISLWLVTSLMVHFVMAPTNRIQRTVIVFENDRTSLLSPMCTVVL